MSGVSPLRDPGEALNQKTFQKKRPDWDDYFMEIACLVANRSTCLRRKVGALLVRGKRILATGYNGAPSGMPHCLEAGCLREELDVPSGQRHELCRGIHAEQNIIIQAAYYGISISESTLYCTHHPCSICTKMLINAGVKTICFKEGYPDDLSLRFLQEAGIEIRRIGKEDKR